jgi:2-amino-4-hydroxy-6-hydroxymethyldihydropteridine diphosphokinase
MSKAYIGIGSNIGDAVGNVQEAFKKLGEIGSLLAHSSLYVTKPWGFANQADFINAVALIEVSCAPDILLGKVLQIERDMGRERLVRWGPRIIDLDILTYDNEYISQEGLSVPHPHMNERAFVLVPLAELDDSFEKALNALPQETLAEVVRIDTSKAYRGSGKP